MRLLPSVGVHSVGFYSSQHLLNIFHNRELYCGRLWKWRFIFIVASHHRRLTWESRLRRMKWYVLSRPVVEVSPFCLQLKVPCSTEIKKFRSRALGPPCLRADCFTWIYFCMFFLNLVVETFTDFVVLLLFCRWITQGHTEILWDNWARSLAYSIIPWISFHGQFF